MPVDSRIEIFERVSIFVQTNFGILLAAIIGSVFVAGLVRTMASYLEAGEPPPVVETNETRNLLEQVMRSAAARDQSIKKLEDALLATPTNVIHLETDEREAIVKDAATRVLEGVPTRLIDIIQNTFDRQFNANATINNASEAFQRVIARLSAAAEEVRKRANVNLIMGTAASVIGLMFLVYFVLAFGPLPTETWQETLVRSIPRLSLVIIIEFLGYFFLGLYRLGTYEVKFFQNEITNVELWAATYLHAMREGDKELGKEIVKKLLNVERNFILKKGETTAFAPESTDERSGLLSDLRALAELARKSKKNPEGAG